MTRCTVRLFVLLGVVFAAYLVLSFFDHAARADVGSIDQSVDQIGATDPVATVKATVTGTRKAVSEPKSIVPKATAAKAHPQRIHRPTIKMAAVHPLKVQAARKVHALKIQVPKKTHALKIQVPKKTHALKIQVPRKIQVPGIRVGETVRRVQVRASKLPAALPSRALLPDLPQVGLPTLPQLPSWPQLPDLPQAQLPTWTQLPDLPQAQLPTWTQLPDLPQVRTPALTRTTALSSSPLPHQPLTPAMSAQMLPLPPSPAFASAPGLSGVTKAQAQPRTAPLPAQPQQPADRSTSTGQARDSGGGSAPAMGTVSSSWRPDVAAVGRLLAADLFACGRTVRYAGPPS